MPIYEYFCCECKNRFEKMRPMSQSDEPATCPTCHQEADRCASTFAAHGENGKALAGSSSGCASCASHNCASCGG
ncbi:MAG: zinc ribbon domain-containing protein [Anaerolineales bacterium]|nr:zinc ribbon domain-containing protein [Anaerolineales bacterium]